jgi:DNA mismatch endonuclease (patch repair protein)
VVSTKPDGGERRGTQVTDIVDRQTRSEMMARIGPRDTVPELAVRRAAHRLGFRFRLHRKDLPGTPDLVFPRHCLAVFVHGCFWHRHEGCPNCTNPKTRPEFWASKFVGNVARDRRSILALECLGWRTLVVWECETEDPAFLDKLVADALQMRSDPLSRVAA